MNFSSLGHQSGSRFWSVTVLALLLTSMVACGGSSGMNSSQNSSDSNSSSGSPTSGSSQDSGIPVSGSGGGVSSSSASTYVYAAIYMDGGGVAGYKQNGTSLSAVSGSPYIQSGVASASALAAVNGYVYVANRPSETGSEQLIQFRSDAKTGTLTQVGTFDAGVTTDTGMRRLVPSPSGKAIYGVFQYTIVSYAIGSDGTPSVIATTTPSTDSVWGFDAIPGGPYAYAAIQNGNPRSGFQEPEIHVLTVGSNGAVTDSRSVIHLPTATGIAGDLKVDPSGKYVVVSTGQTNDQLSVFAIQNDGSLSEVAGSPFSTTAQELRYMAFDSTGKFLYVLNQQDAEPQTESVQVFSFDQATGTLALLQTLPQPNEQIATWLKVDGNFVYVTNLTNGTSSTITTFSRDANNGQLTQVSVTNADKALGQTEVLHQ